MSDDIRDQGYSVWSNELKEPRILSLNLLNNNNSIKIDDKFVIKITKGSKSVNKEIKDSCKILHFSSEWNFEEVLATINGLDSKDYPQLFIFIIEARNLGFTGDNEEQSSTKLAKLQEKFLKFSIDRPMIIQMTSQEENIIKVYYKEETLNQLNAIDQQQNESEDSGTFSSFLCSFLNGKFNDSEIDVLNAVREFENSSLILRFLQTFQLSDGFFGAAVLDIATEGSKAELLAALNSPFDSNGRILSIRAQKYISVVFGDDDPENDDSVLLKAVENENTEVTDYLITYWTHLIQQLPFKHQVQISTAAFETNQLDVLCDLLDIADYPFPKDFKLDSIEHPRLSDIATERIAFKAAIASEDFEKINEFINTNPNLKFIYNQSNNLALTEAVNLKKFGVFYYLKSLNFQGEKCDDILKKLSKEEKEQAVKLAIEQKKKNVNKAEDIAPKTVMLLSMRSSVHNSRTEKIQASKYREQIIKWFADIHKVAPKLIDVAASCDYLKIIFDFESDLVENMSLTGLNSAGSMYPISKWIFVGAKLSDRNGNTTKQREQKIKGVLAHELCHYVMRLVYENQEHPYYKYREDMKELFEEIVKIIDKWSSEDSAGPDDECNRIISSVFKSYSSKDFHPELIVRVVQILAEFDDNEAHLGHLQHKYEILFRFWNIHVIPELQKYLQRNQEVVRLNGTFELLPSIKNLKYELRNGNKVAKIAVNKLVVVQTNVPKLLFINIREYLQQTSGNLYNSQNVFFDPEKFKNQQLLDDFKQICSDNKELSIFIDCSKDIPDNLGNIFVNKELNFIFIVSNEVQCDKLNKIINEQKMENVQKLEINYKWSDLTEESQKLMLNTKINFQNNSQITLRDVIEIDPKVCEATTSKTTENISEDIKDLVDDQLLNLILDNQQVLINKTEMDEKYFLLLFKPRNFIEKTEITDEEYKLVNIDSSDDSDDSENEKPSGFFEKIRIFLGKKKSEKSRVQHKKTEPKIIKDKKILSEVKSKQYVLISDQAGNGKSWAMKNFEKILREQNPKSWVTYVDLKQFIDEFKAQKGEPEFSTFIVENILKLKQKFEAKIVQKFYKNGKVFILFDGFDEIAPNYAEFVSKLAQNFQSNGGNQLWIATRDYFEVDLKEKLKLYVAYRLDKMTEKEGVDLIVRSWVLMDLKMINNEPNSREDFDKCIKISPKYENYQQKAEQIIEKALISRNNSVGLPQLFKMIADGFKDANDIDDLQGSKIYVKFIKLIYKRWSEQKGEIRNEASIDSQDYELNFNKFHQFHAILSLFPKLAALLFPGYDGSEWPEEEIIACGILSLKNGKIYFIHETFREYFVADAIVKVLTRKKVEKEISKILDEILTVNKFKIIRIFIFHTLNEKSMLEKVKPEMEKFVYCGESFGLFFTENLENLVNFSIEVLKNGNYEKVKAVLDKNANSFASNTKSTKLFLKFQEFFINFLKVDDLKNLIIKGTILQGIIKSSLEIENFEDFVIKIEAKTNREFVQKGLMVSSDYRKGNIIYSLTQSSNLNAHKVKKFLEIMEKFFTVTVIFELMSKCYNYDQNILQACVGNGNNENLKVLWTETEKYFADKRTTQSFKEFVKQRDKLNQNILDYAAKCNKIEVHVTLWDLLLKTLENKDELNDFILQKDDSNLVHKLVRRNENPEIIELIFKILKKNFSDAQFQEILTSKGYLRYNLLQSAALSSKVKEIHNFLWKLLKDFCETDEKFLEMVKEVEKDGRNILNIAAGFSSSEVFEFMIQELEKIASRDEIREMLRNLNPDDRNLLQSAVAALLNKSSEIHETLWKTFRKYFENAEILQFIKHVDKFGENLLFNAVEENTVEIVELTWNQIKSFLNHEEQIEYLKMKRKDGENLIQVSLENCYKQEVTRWVESQMKNYKINI